YPIGCSGVITHVDRLPDGRFNLVLRGIQRFRILEEDRDKPYRRAAVDALADPPALERDRTLIRSAREKLETLLAPSLEKDVRVPAAMPDEDLVNALAQYLDLEPVEKQALLERDCLSARAQSLVELLEIKMFAARIPTGSTRAS